MSSLLLKNISKSYADIKILHDMNLSVEKKEFIVVVGPSGCGKSSLLRVVAGLEEPDDGQIYIGDKEVTSMEPKDRDIAMVFQNYALYPHMSVFENIAYGLRIRKVKHDEIEQRVENVATLLQLSPYLQRRPSELSGGQRQRVAMGRAIVRNPTVFLFDEPLSNLDAKLRMEMRIEIKALQQKLGITCLYVTHDQVEAMTMADKIVVLNQGRIEQFDTPMNIYKKPATQFVANFMGVTPMNFAPVKVNGNRIHGLNLIKSMNRAVEHATAIVGIRPEDINISADGADLRIELVEHLGSHQVLFGRLNDGAALTVHAENSGNFHCGDTIKIDFSSAAMHLFDTNTGVRL